PSSTHSLFLRRDPDLPYLHSLPTRRSSDLVPRLQRNGHSVVVWARSDTRAMALLGADVDVVSTTAGQDALEQRHRARDRSRPHRSEEHTSELQSLRHLVCRLLLEKKKKNNQ